MPQTVSTFGSPLHPTRIVENPDAVDNTVLQFFLDYWRKGRGDATLPLNAAFDPKVVRGHLQWVTTADALPDYSDFRFRVVSSRAGAYFLGESTGKTIRETYADVDKAFGDGVLWVYRRACETRAPVRVTGSSSRIKRIFFPSYDSLYLPYSSDGERPDRVVGIFWYDRVQMVNHPSTLVAAAR